MLHDGVEWGRRSDASDYVQMWAGDGADSSYPEWYGDLLRLPRTGFRSGEGGAKRSADPGPPSEEWVTCRKCRNSFPGPTQFVGRRMRCPACGKQVRMPNFRRKFNWYDAWNTDATLRPSDHERNLSEWSRLYPGFFKNLFLLVVLYVLLVLLIFLFGLAFGG